MIREMFGVDRDGLVPLTLLVLFALTARLETVEQHRFPVDVIVAGFLWLGFDSRLRLGQILRLRDFVGVRRLVVFVLGFDELEERIGEEFLLEVLLEVEQGHVQQIHRLIQARIDLELLSESGTLLETWPHDVTTSSSASAKRARSRAVSVGPK